MQSYMNDKKRKHEDISSKDQPYKNDFSRQPAKNAKSEDSSQDKYEADFINDGKEEGEDDEDEDEEEESSGARGKRLARRRE